MSSEADQCLPQRKALWPDGMVPMAMDALKGLPRITLYRPCPESATGQSVVICPGGGYGHLAVSKEGHRPAQWLSAHGVASAVLEYRHSPFRHPVPLIDAQRAIRVMRHYTGQWGLNAGQVGIMGFSAGGHLAGSAALLQHDIKPCILDAQDTINRLSPCANFGILVYPVIRLTGELAHGGSARNLLGDDHTGEEAARWNVDANIHADSPPMLLIHTQADRAVPAGNSLVLFEALTRVGVPSSMHLYPQPGHGFGMGRDHPWPESMLNWLRSLL